VALLPLPIECTSVFSMQRIMESIPGSAEAGGAGGASSYKALQRLDEMWLKMRSRTPGNEIFLRNFLQIFPRMCNF
jgi:hypothetical protein